MGDREWRPVARAVAAAPPGARSCAPSRRGSTSATTTWIAEVGRGGDRRRRVRARPTPRAVAQRLVAAIDGRRPARAGRRSRDGLAHARAAGRRPARGRARDDAGGVRARHDRDVLVLGAGLAGLVRRARPRRAGADVLVLEARDRPGGRVERAVLEDGRSVQMGGELIGDFHTAYLGLAAELGLEPEPSYVAEPGLMSWELAEGAGQGDHPPFFTPADVADAERFEARVAQLAATVDPADPWSHPDAAAARRALVRRLAAGRGRAPGRDPAARPGRALDGRRLDRAPVAARPAPDDRGGRGGGGLRLRPLGGTAPARRQRRAPARDGRRARRARPATARASSRCTPAARAASTLAGGEELRAEAIVCALPVGPLRDVAVSGVSDARLASLHRQRHALAAKVVAAFPDPVWRAVRRQRPRRRGEHHRLDLAAGRRRALDARRPGAARALPRRAGARPPGRGARDAGPALRRGGARARRAARARTGASIRSPRATSPSGRPATSARSARSTGRTSRRSTSAAPTTGWPGYMEGAVRTGRAAAAAALGATSAATA